MSTDLSKTIVQYKQDPESVYHTWFLNNEDRLKAFRTIKRGLVDVISHIEQRTFGTDFKGSSLEVVVTAISEQKQVFEGAAHAFFWKPKLRIPDIYENDNNQIAFGRFLKSCLQASNETQVIEAILKLDQQHIKGLGPAVANILYFLHPTLFPPFNTAIVTGFNALLHDNIKLGSWMAYLDMREKILDMNNQYKNLLSKDLGAIAGLLFEIGTNRIVLEETAELAAQQNEKRSKNLRKRHEEVLEELNEENEHTEMQYHLTRLGRSLGYNVWVARNDHSREFDGQRLGALSLGHLGIEDVPASVLDTISLIDVIWLHKDGHAVCAFEVEKSTSIYSGILRLHDLSLSVVPDSCKLFLVAPKKREKEIVAQLLRPSIRQNESPQISYILFPDLRCDCDAMCKYGSDMTVLEKIAKVV